nr:hypothetical protein [Tanacetum cinerariifolium]
MNASKEVDIGLDGGNDKKLRPTDMLLYSWDKGLDTKLLQHVGIVASGSTFEEALCMFNNAMWIDFLSNPSEMALCQSQREDHTSDWLRVVPIFGLGQTMNEADAVTLLKHIQKFSMAQDIGERAAIHIFNMISFAIAKGVEAQIVSRLPSNLL